MVRSAHSSKGAALGKQRRLAVDVCGVRFIVSPFFFCPSRTVRRPGGRVWHAMLVARTHDTDRHSPTSIPSPFSSIFLAITKSSQRHHPRHQAQPFHTGHAGPCAGSATCRHQHPSQAHPTSDPTNRLENQPTIDHHPLKKVSPSSTRKLGDSDTPRLHSAETGPTGPHT